MKNKINRLIAITVFVVMCLSFPEYMLGQGQIKRKKQTRQESIQISNPDGYINGHGYVDLGLPSGTKWATCNIGAEKSIEIGNYYSWGEYKIKEVYDYDKSETIYKHIDCIAGSSDFDTAKRLWGDNWNMPTVEQWKELFSKTKVKYHTINSIRGFIFIGRNNKTIFIPYGGEKEGKNIFLQNHFGRYWTSNADYRYDGTEYPFHPDNAYASVCYFQTAYDKPSFFIDPEWRGHGFPIRPVCSK